MCVNSWTFKNHVYFLRNSHPTTMCADPPARATCWLPAKRGHKQRQLTRGLTVETAACAYQKQAAGNTAYAGYTFKINGDVHLTNPTKGAALGNAGHSHGCRPNAVAGLSQ